MNIREPKKKHYVRLKPQPPFPITIGNDNEWTVYTAHLTHLGVCVLNPDEIHALHTMGFFGKGSLSRSYPSFGKVKYGAPPVIRNRQWLRRKQWSKEERELNIELEFEANLKVANEAQEKLKQVSRNDEDVTATEEIRIIDGINCSDKKEKTKKNSQHTLNNKKDDTPINYTLSDSSEEDDVCIINNEETQYDLFSKNTVQSELSNYKMEDKNQYATENINTSTENKLLVLPDSDSETEDYLKNITPRVEPASYPIQETLHLTYEETFFLLYGLGCLKLLNFDGTVLTIDGAWEYFCKIDKYFIQKYVAYHYFRSKGWVVKPGLKYGGDFLLYKQGPPFYHASYIVIIEVIDADTLVLLPSKNMRNLTWNILLGLERLSETAAKEIMFAQILWPSSVPLDSVPISPDVLLEFTVKELLWRRWNPKHNNDTTYVGVDDEDSC